MSDDDLSIPVLADILEPGDPDKVDPAVPRQPMGHAWTDALVRESHVHAHPLAAVPMLTDVLESGDPARARHAPQPADASLNIPLLTEVLSYREATGGAVEDETSGAPIPVLTDVFDDFDVPAGQTAPVPGETQVHADRHVWAEGDARTAGDAPAVIEAQAFEVDDVPLSADVFVDPIDPIDPALAKPVSTHEPIDLSTVAVTGDAHLFDSELPFRAYCSFPGDAPRAPLDAGDSAVPPVYPMAAVPLPFGSAIVDTLPSAHAEPEPDAQAGSTAQPEALRSVIAPESSDPAAVSVHPVPFEPIVEEVLEEPIGAAAPSEAPAETHGPGIAADEADHLAAMLSRPEPVAAELTVPQPEVLPLSGGGVPTQAEIDHVVTDVRARALRYLSGEGHALIESRCQEQAVWLAHRITREIAATLEREIGEWIQQALNDALEQRQTRP